jgi:3-dehydroquinate synthase
MKTIKQSFSVPFTYDVAFTDGLFQPENDLFLNQVKGSENDPIPKILFVLDEGMVQHHPGLFDKICNYHDVHKSAFEMVSSPVVIPGGEEAKNKFEYIQQILDAIEREDIDRHSYVTVIGGGAVVDAAGYAASVAHRGVRLIRVPTTVLSQNDASVGVKNGINAYGKKNFLGTFTPPQAVLNDFEFLQTLEQRDWRAGIAEAIKVALIKDADFFNQLEKNATLLEQRDMNAMKQLIHRCAELHLDHIRTAGDPFEMGSSRPLDFGHWAAHKLEQLTHYELRHGEAVAIGIAVDSVYSQLIGKLSKKETDRILNLFHQCGFQLYVPELEQQLDQPDHEDSILHGLEEFREHLGGKLTIMLLNGIGLGFEVHEVDFDLYQKAVQILKTFETEPV